MTDKVTTQPTRSNPSPGICGICRRALPTRPREENRVYCPSSGALNCVSEGFLRLEVDLATANGEIARLTRLLPPGGDRAEGGVGEDSWAVFAEKVVAQRDDLGSQLEGMIREVAEWTAYGRTPLGGQTSSSDAEGLRLAREWAASHRS